MKLTYYSRLKLDSIDSLYICREVQIGNITSLILGMQTVNEEIFDYDEENGDCQIPCEKTRTRLYIMYESNPDIYDDEYDESIYTLRQNLMHSINEKPQPAPSDIEEIIINGNTLYYSEMNNGCVEWLNYRTLNFISECIKSDIIPPKWLCKNSARIWIAEYIFDDVINLRELAKEQCQFDFKVNKPPHEYFIGKTFTCRVDDDTNHVFTIEIDGEEIPVTVHGLELFNAMDENFFILPYRTRDDLELDFYSKSHLNKQCTNGSCGVGLIMADPENQWKYSVITKTCDDPADFVEIELLCARKYKSD